MRREFEWAVWMVGREMPRQWYDHDNEHLEWADSLCLSHRRHWMRAKKMKRDMNLIRAIVLAIRDHEGRPSASEVQTLIRDDENAVYAYHIALLTQSAMVIGVDTGERKDRYGVANLSLTWAGQDFADNILNDEVWASAQKKLDAAKLNAASFEIWSQLASAKITDLLDGS